MKREQCLRTPAASILTALTLQNKAEVLTFIRLDVERQGEGDARPISVICIQGDAFDTLLSVTFPLCFSSILERGRETSKTPKQTDNTAGITSAHT